MWPFAPPSLYPGKCGLAPHSSYTSSRHALGTGTGPGVYAEEAGCKPDPLTLGGPNAGYGDAKKGGLRVREKTAEDAVKSDSVPLFYADPVVIPRNGKLTALGAVLPLQFIAYELALLRGVNPDFPRHLAKSVTVD